MKKVIALAIVAVMLVCSVSAILNPEDTTKVTKNPNENISFDTFFINGAMPNDVQPADGGADTHINAVEGGLVIKDSWETFGVRGWVGFKTAAQAIVKFGYQINENDPVFDDSFKKDTEDAVVAASQVSDPSHASRFEITIPVAGLTEPTLLTAVAQLADGTVAEVIQFSVNGQYTAAADDDEPAEEAADFGPWDGVNFTTGWWMTRMAETQTVTINFTAPNGFDGMKGFYFASAADVRINLYDAAGNELENIEQNFAGDGAADTAFSKAYPAGDYTLKFTSIGGTHWVLGSCDGTGFECELTAENIDTNDATKAFPCILFTGAAAEGDAPETADAAIVVAAAVAAIALAGVVVCKKANA